MTIRTGVSGSDAHTAAQRPKTFHVHVEKHAGLWRASCERCRWSASDSEYGFVKSLAVNHRCPDA